MRDKAKCALLRVRQTNAPATRGRHIQIHLNDEKWKSRERKKRSSFRHIHISWNAINKVKRDIETRAKWKDSTLNTISVFKLLAEGNFFLFLSSFYPAFFSRYRVFLYILFYFFWEKKAFSPPACTGARHLTLGKRCSILSLSRSTHCANMFCNVSKHTDMVLDVYKHWNHFFFFFFSFIPMLASRDGYLAAVYTYMHCVGGNKLKRKFTTFSYKVKFQRILASLDFQW